MVRSDLVGPFESLIIKEIHLPNLKHGPLQVLEVLKWADPRYLGSFYPYLVMTISTSVVVLTIVFEALGKSSARCFVEPIVPRILSENSLAIRINPAPYISREDSLDSRRGSGEEKPSIVSPRENSSSF